ncbi:hypothetical protein, partial [Micromonospora sp. NPDC047730]|uniref:hypothetical protein n=1 Tax=unclassified Micromonospora TaxID=2617518 RepID=UPI003712CC72
MDLSPGSLPGRPAAMEWGPAGSDADGQPSDPAETDPFGVDPDISALWDNPPGEADFFDMRTPEPGLGWLPPGWQSEMIEQLSAVAAADEAAFRQWADEVFDIDPALFGQGKSPHLAFYKSVLNAYPELLAQEGVTDLRGARAWATHRLAVDLARGDESKFRELLPYPESVSPQRRKALHRLWLGKVGHAHADGHDISHVIPHIFAGELGAPMRVHHAFGAPYDIGPPPVAGVTRQPVVWLNGAYIIVQPRDPHDDRIAARIAEGFSRPSVTDQVQQATFEEALRQLREEIDEAESNLNPTEIYGLIQQDTFHRKLALIRQHPISPRSQVRELAESRRYLRRLYLRSRNVDGGWKDQNSWQLEDPFTISFTASVGGDYLPSLMATLGGKPERLAVVDDVAIAGDVVYMSFGKLNGVGVGIVKIRYTVDGAIYRKVPREFTDDELRALRKKVPGREWELEDRWFSEDFYHMEFRVDKKRRLSRRFGHGQFTIPNSKMVDGSPFTFPADLKEVILRLGYGMDDQPFGVVIIPADKNMTGRTLYLEMDPAPTADDIKGMRSYALWERDDRRWFLFDEISASSEMWSHKALPGLDIRINGLAKTFDGREVDLSRGTEIKLRVGRMEASGPDAGARVLSENLFAVVGAPLVPRPDSPAPEPEYVYRLIETTVQGKEEFEALAETLKHREELALGRRGLQPAPDPQPSEPAPDALSDLPAAMEWSGPAVDSASRLEGSAPVGPSDLQGGVTSAGLVDVASGGLLSGPAGDYDLSGFDPGILDAGEGSNSGAGAYLSTSALGSGLSLEGSAPVASGPLAGVSWVGGADPGPSGAMTAGGSGGVAPDLQRSVDAAITQLSAGVTRDQATEFEQWADKVFNIDSALFRGGAHLAFYRSVLNTYPQLLAQWGVTSVEGLRAWVVRQLADDLARGEESTFRKILPYSGDVSEQRRKALERIWLSTIGNNQTLDYDVALVPLHVLAKELDQPMQVHHPFGAPHDIGPPLVPGVTPQQVLRLKGAYVLAQPRGPQDDRIAAGFFRPDPGEQRQQAGVFEETRGLLRAAIAKAEKNPDSTYSRIRRDSFHRNLAAIRQPPISPRNQVQELAEHLEYLRDLNNQRSGWKDQLPGNLEDPFTIRLPTTPARHDKDIRELTRPAPGLRIKLSGKDIVLGHVGGLFGLGDVVNISFGKVGEKGVGFIEIPYTADNGAGSVIYQPINREFTEGELHSLKQKVRASWELYPPWEFSASYYIKTRLLQPRRELGITLGGEGGAGQAHATARQGRIPQVEVADGRRFVFPADMREVRLELGYDIFGRPIAVVILEENPIKQTLYLELVKPAPTVPDIGRLLQTGNVLWEREDRWDLYDAISIKDIMLADGRMPRPLRLRLGNSVDVLGGGKVNLDKGTPITLKVGQLPRPVGLDVAIDIFAVVGVPLVPRADSPVPEPEYAFRLVLVGLDKSIGEFEAIKAQIQARQERKERAETGTGRAPKRRRTQGGLPGGAAAFEWGRVGGGSFSGGGKGVLPSGWA